MSEKEKLLSQFPDTMTVGELRAHLRHHWKEGCKCVCGGFVKLYKRPITSAMAYGLILFYKHWKTHKEWTHMETMLKEADCVSSIRGDMSKLKYWGLILVHEHNEGFYKISAKGLEFVEGRTKVESHVQLYNNRFFGYSGNFVDIHHCLKNKFDYKKLLEGTL